MIKSEKRILFLTVDSNTRRIGFGDPDPLFSISVSEKKFDISAFGNKLYIPIPKLSDDFKEYASEAISCLVSPALRLAYGLFEFIENKL